MSLHLDIATLKLWVSACVDTELVVLQLLFLCVSKSQPINLSVATFSL